MEPKRPNPDQILAQVKKDETQRGKLKIFFGACAGAGKTYAMLLAAQEKNSEGVSVVAGFIETHGRLETLKLLEGIENLPMAHYDYQGIRIPEFDIDAAISRNPDILLLDELAHSNAPGARHPKRWQDVQELLEYGIDVYTTLNVQHLESLNDLVTNLTGIRVKETVPDSIFDIADEIVLVDIPSEIILARLEEGKVYLGEFAKQRAAQHFFKIENLIALREMALRRTAERVDALRDLYKKYQNSGKKQSIADKILVCIGPKTISTKLVRTAKQQATKLKCSWTALYIENEEYHRLTKEEKIYIEKTIRLTDQLGGKHVIIQETKTAQAIIDFASNQGFSKIFIGKSAKPKWKQKIFGSLVNDIIELSNTIDVYIVHEDMPEKKRKRSISHPPWMSYIYTLIIITVCTLIGLPMKEWLEPENVVMIYLAGVVMVAVSSERSAAILAALFSVISYNWFFTNPYNNLRTYHIHDLVTLGVLLLTGLLISSQTSQLRLQNLLLKQREKYTADLYAFTRKLMITPGKARIAKVIAQHISESFECAATVWLPNDTGYLELASHPGINPDFKEASVAQWAFAHHQIAGLGTNTMPSARGYYIPLSNGESLFGVLGIIPKDPNKTFSLEENAMLEALSIQAASALERVKIAAQIEKNSAPKTIK